MGRTRLVAGALLWLYCRQPVRYSGFAKQLRRVHHAAGTVPATQAALPGVHLGVSPMPCSLSLTDLHFCVPANPSLAPRAVGEVMRRLIEEEGWQMIVEGHRWGSKRAAPPVCLRASSLCQYIMHRRLPSQYCALLAPHARLAALHWCAGGPAPLAPSPTPLPQPGRRSSGPHLPQAPRAVPGAALPGVWGAGGAGVA